MDQVNTYLVREHTEAFLAVKMDQVREVFGEVLAVKMVYIQYVNFLSFFGSQNESDIYLVCELSWALMAV